MTDSKDDKTLDNEGKKTLKLKPSGVSQGTVRQDMGRGRSKAVVVETRKRRIHKPGEDTSAASASRAPASQSAQPRQGETRRTMTGRRTTPRASLRGRARRTASAAVSRIAARIGAMPTVAARTASAAMCCTISPRVRWMPAAARW